MQLDRLLTQIGFSKNEAKVYLSALESGPSTASKLANEAGLPRTTVYFILNALIDRGVMGKTTEQGKNKFVADPPEKLLTIITDLKTQVEKELPRFEAMYNTSETKPKIYFYEGKGAIRKAFDDTLEVKPDEILMWNTDLYFDFDKYGLDKDYINNRVKLNMHAKRIAGEGSVWHTRNKPHDEQELSETVVVPRNIFWPGIEVNIYANKVVFMNFVENNSVLIESKAIADAMRQAYYLSWVGAKKLEVVD
ncbi:MAG: helix-turn-helix domain-containing protein [Candidatus Magasanikbacteria bacterium]